MLLSPKMSESSKKKNKISHVFRLRASCSNSKQLTNCFHCRFFLWFSSTRQSIASHISHNNFFEFFKKLTQCSYEKMLIDCVGGPDGKIIIWLSFMTHRPCVRHDLEPSIFPFGPPTQSITTYYFVCVQISLVGLTLE